MGSEVVAKIFATWISTDNANVKAICWQKLADMHAKKSACFYFKDRQRHTVHGDIPFGKVTARVFKPEPKPEPQRVYAYTPPTYEPEPEPQRTYTPPTYDEGPTVRHRHIPLNHDNPPTTDKNWQQKFEDRVRASSVRWNNRNPSY